MKKTLFTLLTATSLMSTSFAASTTELPSPTISEADGKATPLAVKHTSKTALGYSIPSLFWNPETKQFAGSPIGIILSDIGTIVLSLEKPPIKIAQPLPAEAGSG